MFGFDFVLNRNRPYNQPASRYQRAVCWMRCSMDCDGANSRSDVMLELSQAHDLTVDSRILSTLNNVGRPVSRANPWEAPANTHGNPNSSGTVGASRRFSAGLIIAPQCE